MSEIKNLIVLYYITSGPKHKKMYGGKKFCARYPLKNNRNNINLEIIREILEKDKVNIALIDDYRYYNKNKKGLIKIKESSLIKIKPNELLYLQIHLKEMDIYYKLCEIDNFFEKIKFKISQLEEIKNNKNKKIDLYYLFASPIVSLMEDKYVESSTPINYREEIKNLVSLFYKSKKEYICFFECGTEKNFREALSKEPKILHLSSHGKLSTQKEFSLCLEDRGELKKIPQSRLSEILKSYSRQLKKIELVFASTCHSQFLGNLFLENGVKNVICIQGITPISDKAALQFSENLYNEIIKGNTIQEAFNKAQQRVQSSKEKESFRIINCCCFNHNHLYPCPLDDKVNRNKIHENYHSKNKCKCEFEECNIHENNCKLLELIKNNKDEKYFCFEKNIRNTIKICCSCLKNQIPPHGESFKFILLPETEKDQKNIIFPNKKEGKLINNRICYDTNYNNFNDFFIVGRKDKVKEIYELIGGEKNNNIHYLIIYGSEDTGKKNFALSVCLFLYERKVIAGYKYFDIKQSISSYKDIKELIYKWNNSIGKFAIIIELNNNYLEKSINEVNKFLDEPSFSLPNIYYFILLTSEKDKITYSIDSSINHYNIIKLEELNEKYSLNLLKDLCDYYGYSKYLVNFKEEEKTELIKIIPRKTFKKINELAELIGQNKNFEQIKNSIQNANLNIIENEQNKLGKTMEKNISKIYFLLSIVKNGLPLSIIKLYEPQFERIKEKEDENNLIFTDIDNNWYIIEEFRKINIIRLMPEDKRKIYIRKILKIYSRSLFYYINKNWKSVCFPDSNIHYNFNSYNNKGLWKTFDTEIYQICFEKKRNKINNDYIDILDKDSNIKLLEKHKENIFSIIEKNIDIIKDIIYKDKDKNKKTKEYLSQILIMLPSIFNSKTTETNSIKKDIISKCIFICDKLMSDEGNLMEVRQRLNLFLESLKKNPTINLDKFNLLGDEGKAEAYFLYGLKLHNQDLFNESIKYYTNVDDNEVKSKIIYAKYEIAKLLYLEKKYKDEEKILYEALELDKENKDSFIKDKIYIELAKIIQKEIINKERETIDKKEYEKLLDYVINKNDNRYLVNEAINLKEEFYKQLEADIIMLNSNPLITKKDNYELLHNKTWFNHNNQYYILNKLSGKLGRYLRIKSKILNKDNLIEALNSKGKILVIQSDDFNEEGEIMLESDYGEGERLPKDILEKSIIPEKILYDVVILCFIKSGKLIDLFKGKSKYLITFDDIKTKEIDSISLKNYNVFTIDFLVDFIKNTTKFTIEKSFNDSKDTFLKLVNNKIDSLKNFNLITLTPKPDKNMDQENTIYGQKIFDVGNEKEIFFYPLIEYHISINNFDFRTDEYTDYIIKLIKLILKGNHIINIYSKNDIPINKLNTKLKISNEVIKFLYRHQKFNKFFFIYNSKKFGGTLKEITNNIIGIKKKNNNSKENNAIISETLKSAFFVINNYDEIKKRKGNQGKDIFFDDVPKNYQYLIISKSIININNSKNIINKVTNEEIDIKNNNKNNNNNNNSNNNNNNSNNNNNNNKKKKKKKKKKDKNKNKKNKNSENLEKNIKNDNN